MRSSCIPLFMNKIYILFFVVWVVVVGVVGLVVVAAIVVIVPPKKMNQSIQKRFAKPKGISQTQCLSEQSMVSGIFLFQRKFIFYMHFMTRSYQNWKMKSPIHAFIMPCIYCLILDFIRETVVNVLLIKEKVKKLSSFFHI